MKSTLKILDGLVLLTHKWVEKMCHDINTIYVYSYIKMPYKKYTDKQKAAYYKKKAEEAQKNRYQRGTGGFKKVRYDYPGVGKKIGSYMGSMVGNAIAPGVGGVAGDALGGAIGQGAHYLTKRVTGFGDYSVKKNSLVYNRDAVPQFTNSPHCTVITHREFIKDIRSSVAFESSSFRINPAISDTFPWLSQIADSYEQYVVQGMIFEFKTTSATAIGSTNTALGTVIMATQYNSLAPEFINKQQMESYEFAQSSVPCNSIMHAIECDPAQTQGQGLFNMWNSQDNSGDLRLYDIGRFTIATQGSQAAATIGELWVTYKICLLKPRLQSDQDVAAFYQLQAASIIAANPLGAIGTQIASPNNSLNFVELSPSTSNEFTIDPGFTGILQLTIVYRLTSFVAFRNPVFSPHAGNVVDVSENYVLQQDSNITGGGDPGTGPYTYISQAYFSVSGGYDASGNPPTIRVVSMTSNTAIFSTGVLSIISVPNTIQNPF